MQIPPAGIIEMALDDLGKVPADKLAKQRAELESAVGTVSDDCAAAYNHGLQTARVMLRQNTLLQLKDIKASDLL